MNIALTNAGKRFNKDWIFRNLTYTFEQGSSYAIIGPNGSGKSTLLQVLAANMNITEGSGQWKHECKQLDTEQVYKHISIAAPYLEVIEEMTGKEFLAFHSMFKPLIQPVDEILNIVGLKKAADKQIRNYSSGMRQRIKLAQAIFSNTPVLLLDEPCTNLDTTGCKLYNQLINDYGKQRLIIVSSNDVQEYGFCRQQLNMIEYKPANISLLPRGSSSAVKRHTEE